MSVVFDDPTLRLRAPFPHELVLFRPLRNKQGGWDPLVEVAPYVNRALVIDRLNVACGLRWSMTFAQATGAGTAWCHLTIDGTTRSDVGDLSDMPSITGERTKALVTDALKRAAFQFGVGVSLSAIPRLEYAPGTANNSSLKRIGDDVILTDRGREACRARYAEWLDRVGIAAYGGVLSHGAPDAHRPEPGETRAQEADRLNRQAEDDELRRESEIKAVEDLARELDVEQPMPKDESTWPALIATLRSAVEDQRRARAGQIRSAA